MLKLDHVVFPVRDAGESLAFYRDVLELPLVDAHEGDDWGSYPWLMMIFALPDGGEIVLVELKDAPRPKYKDLPKDVRHYAMAEGSIADLAGWRKKLRTAGVRFWEEDHGAQQSIYFEDPDGVVLEITAPPTRPADTASARAARAVQRWLGAHNQPQA
ncbi:VOC family protein [Phenylobacterium sp.]|uniref:VOC family protein n=1 Tax=Phenylobacterium sp. TaxID=1871053 RepID=UPI00273559E8|nr:VOC family protein [Phenylobacterium sp.]MDP3856059.1 VOC family protein [Phenylobacterium sp.]